MSVKKVLVNEEVGNKEVGFIDKVFFLNNEGFEDVFKLSIVIRELDVER